MANTAQKALDALLARLENDELERPVKRRRFQGTREADVFTGDERNNVANGKQGDDVLNGNGGNERFLGGNGNDLLLGGSGADSLLGGNNQDILLGGLDNDLLDGGNGNDILDGGSGTDVLTGGNGNDMLVGGDGVDTLTGGIGIDQFVYSGDVFANGPVAPAGQTGINALNQPDLITDYTIGQDQFVFDKVDLGMDTIAFQKGQAAQIAGDGNVIVLTDAFAAAGAAARAIANNENIKAREGVFAYFNSTLGITRLVYSNDLANGGNISVLANLDNQRGAPGLANIGNFTTADFTLT